MTRPLILMKTSLFLLTILFANYSAAQEMRVILLGTGSPGPYTDRAGPATLVIAGNQTLLFDAGRNAVVQLWQKRIPVRNIDSVFLTHFHHDHFNGLADLWLTGWIGTEYGLRNSPMRLVGPVGTETIASGLELAYSRNNEIRVLDENLPVAASSFSVSEFQSPGVIYEEDGVSVTAFNVNHGELITPAVGYRVDYMGLSTVISGDTTYDERLVAASVNTDLLIHEVMAWDDESMRTVPTSREIAAHHTTPEEAGQIFSQAEPRLAAYSHLVVRNTSDEELINRTRNYYSGPLVVGSDLMEFLISPQEIEIIIP
jgi:ribonuclease Z